MNSDSMSQICEQLAGETAALAAIATDLTEEQWSLPTPAQGWDSRDTIIHIGMGDWAATLATTDPAGFEQAKAKMFAGETDLETAAGIDFDSLSGTELWGWFEAERTKMVEAFSQVSPKDRIPWFGPDMGARMFATARLMETWSHAHDVADTFGQPYPKTDRLRGVAHIGVVTRGWSYANRGLDIPEDEICVTLSAPEDSPSEGDVWTWGDPSAANAVSGSAYDFCLAATQRRHYTETELVVVGEAAIGWMEIAQAFAGEATTVAVGRTA